MFDTLTPRSTTGEFETMLCARPDPGGFLLEARTGAREAAAHMIPHFPSIVDIQCGEKAILL